LSSISDLQLFKRRESGSEELEALVDLLPQATLIVDANNSRVLIANSKASQLSAYTRNEFSELELGTLIPALSGKNLSELLSSIEASQPQTVITRSSQTIETLLTATSLGGTEQWLAITLAPSLEVEVKQSETKRQHERWEALHLLTLAGQQNELASSFRQILQAGNILTGAPHLALYTKSEGDNKLNLTAVSGSGLEFPADLAEDDLGRLRSPTIWQSGVSIESPLHKLAQTSKLKYLASTPLDLTQPTMGLIVAAEEDNEPSNDLLAILQILAASSLTAAINQKLVEQVSSRVNVLAQSNQLSEALQTNVQEGLLVLNKDFTVEHINPAAVDIFGYNETEALGLAAADILISSKPILKALDEAIENGKGIDLGESNLHRRNGSEFPAYLRIAPISENDSVVSIAVIISDFSENQALHLRSQQLQKRAWLGEVTAIFAHEVTNPINNISSGLQLMQTDFDEDDPLQEQLKRLLDDCDLLDHRLKQVLSFSQNLKHEPEDLNISEFCRMQLERWKPRMARKNIDYHFQANDILPHILGDHRALDQVFTNLITNAIQAMQDQESGVIAINISGPSSGDSANYVDIQFSDTGPGIPEELRKRVFDPFFTTKEDGGTGLGLAITKRIIMAHKGKINIESFPGGTHFKIKLPVSSEKKG